MSKTIEQLKKLRAEAINLGVNKEIENLDSIERIFTENALGIYECIEAGLGQYATNEVYSEQISWTAPFNKVDNLKLRISEYEEAGIDITTEVWDRIPNQEDLAMAILADENDENQPWELFRISKLKELGENNGLDVNSKENQNKQFEIKFSAKLDTMQRKVKSLKGNQ